MYLNFIAIRLTIHTVLRMEDGMKIVDETGRVHNLSVATVRTMIGTGWGAFIAAWLLNIAFYKVQCVVNKSLNFILLCLPVRFIRLEWTWRSAGSGTKW